jgi:hypothetical protein
MHSIKLSFLFIWVIFILCGQMTAQPQPKLQPPESKQQKDDFSSGDAFKNSKIIFNLIPGINKTWGYDILVNNKLTIHQPSVPAMPGNEGFKTKEGAEKVARLVIKKMKKGEMPPSVDAEELKKLKAI